MGYGGPSSGGSISSSSDVALNSPTDSQVLTYDSGTAKWKNQTPPGASAPIVVRWDGSSWGTYDTDTTKVRIFYSQNDPNATAPIAYNVNDDWRGVDA